MYYVMKLLPYELAPPHHIEFAASEKFLLGTPLFWCHHWKIVFYPTVAAEIYLKNINKNNNVCKGITSKL